MNLFWFHSVLRLCTSKKGPSKRKYSSYRHLSKDMCCYFPLPSPSPNLFSACLFCGSVAGLPSQWLSQPPTWQASAWFQPAEGSQENGRWKKRGSDRVSLPTSLSMCGPISGTICLSTTTVPGEEPCVSSSSQRHPCSNSTAVSSQDRPVLREVVMASCCYGSVSFSASLVGALHLPSLQVELRLSLFTWVIRVNFSFLMGP